MAARFLYAIRWLNAAAKFQRNVRIETPCVWVPGSDDSSASCLGSICLPDGTYFFSEKSLVRSTPIRGRTKT